MSAADANGAGYQSQSFSVSAADTNGAGYQSQSFSVSAANTNGAGVVVVNSATSNQV